MEWAGTVYCQWQKLTALRDLLLPFAEHSQMLQSDTMSLSLVLPALLDLNAHLSEFPEAQGSCYRDLASLSQTMKENMGQRFSCFLDPSDTKFSPLIAAACFLDPTVSPKALIENEHDDVQIQELLIKAEDYIAQMVSPVIREEETDDNEDEEERREVQKHIMLRIDRNVTVRCKLCPGQKLLSTAVNTTSNLNKHLQRTHAKVKLIAKDPEPRVRML
ncbi:hypothetical protein NQZ68_008664 [Dissostichus eleginoides]|nr:hypothetical protein NQZ68_008664 [Dissostichus eleginoides]